MFYFKIRIKNSNIEGKGVFADEDISKDSIVWKFQDGHDTRESKDVVAKMSGQEKNYYERFCYLSPTSNMWVCPPKDDLGNYVNHSKENNLTIKIDEEISPEPYFIANRDIKKGDEITNNYAEFDEFTKNNNPEWL